MIKNIEQIRSVASKDQFMNEIKVFIENLITQDKSKALYLVRTLFFAPETHPRVRHMIAQYLGKLGQKQLFQQLLSYFILRKFPDNLSLLAAIGSFKDPEAMPALVEYYTQGNFRECREILRIATQVRAPETVEFLSQIYNEQIEYKDAFDAQELQELRQLASEAMGKNIMRFELGD